MLHGTVCKDACGIFGGNALESWAFVLDRNEYRSQQVVPFCDRVLGLAPADRLAVDLGALGETGARTLGGNVLMIVSFNRT